MNDRSPHDLKIVSLLPSATEMVAELGQFENLQAVSHACDFPQGVADIPIITKSIVPEGLSSAEIDAFVARALRDGRSLYTIDEDLLRRIAPDVVITQELCDVCAVNHETVATAVGRLEKKPELVSLDPGCIEDIFSDFRRVGAALHVPDQAERIVTEGRKRLQLLEQRVAGLPRPRVLTLEWYEPAFYGGHWVPEQVLLGGGTSAVGAAHERSERISWEELGQLDPDTILLMPCGYHLEQALELSAELCGRPHWEALRAVQDGNVIALDANACFSRPSLRVILGAEIIGHVLHPHAVPAPFGRDLFARLPRTAQ